MDEHGLAARQLVGKLADGLEEGQPLDVADRAADLDQNEVDALIAVGDEGLDGVGDVRDDLHGRAEIVAAALLGDDLLIDAPRGDVVGLARRAAGEALIVAEVEIGLGAVVGDEHFAVLIGAHGPRIDVEIGVELAQPHAVTARLEQRPESGRCQPLAERGDHAAGNEDVPRHGPRPYTESALSRSPPGDESTFPVAAGGSVLIHAQ